MKFWWIFVFMILVFDGPIKGYGDEVEITTSPSDEITMVLTTSFVVKEETTTPFYPTTPDPTDVLTEKLNTFIGIFESYQSFNESDPQLIAASSDIGSLIYSGQFYDLKSYPNFNAAIENYFSILNQSIKHTEDIIRNVVANDRTPNSDVMLTDVHIPFRALQKSYEKMTKNLDSPNFFTFFKDGCQSYNPVTILEKISNSVNSGSKLAMANNYCDLLFKHVTILYATCEAVIKGPQTDEDKKVQAKLVQDQIAKYEHNKAETLAFLSLNNKRK